MTLFKKKAKHNLPALFFSLDRELEIARARKETHFYYPLKDHEVNQAMTWGIRHRVGIQLDHKTDNELYYKFFGYSMEG